MLEAWAASCRMKQFQDVGFAGMGKRAMGTMGKEEEEER